MYDFAGWITPVGTYVGVSPLKDLAGDFAHTLLVEPSMFGSSWMINEMGFY